MNTNPARRRLLTLAALQEPETVRQRLAQVDAMRLAVFGRTR